MKSNQKKIDELKSQISWMEEDLRDLVEQLNALQINEEVGNGGF